MVSSNFYLIWNNDIYFLYVEGFDGELEQNDTNVVYGFSVENAKYFRKDY